jgi:hypothetical protein
LVAYDRLAFNYSEVYVIVGQRRLMLIPYLCEVCGIVQLYWEPELPPRPTQRKRGRED